MLEAGDFAALGGMPDVQLADPDGECGIASALMGSVGAPSTTTRDDILVPGGCIVGWAIRGA